MTIPAHNRETCQDVKVSCIKFVLPEDLSLAEGADGFSICGDRQFKSKSFIAHYIDTDYQCCDVLFAACRIDHDKTACKKLQAVLYVYYL